MPEWPEELLAGLDGARPLPAGLRSRLEQALAAPAPSPTRPLDRALSTRLEDALADPLADPLAAALADAEQPRPLRPAARRRIEKALGAGRRSWRPGAAVAAGVLVLAGVGLGLGLSVTGGTGSPSPGRAALPTTRLGTAAHSAPAPTAATPLSSSGAVASASPAAQPQAVSGLPGPSAAPSAPQIGAVDPVGGPTAGGNWVTVTGTGLAGATTVEFGTSPAQFQVVSGTELRALAPAHTAATVDVRVTTAQGQSAAGPADHYTYR